MIKSKLVANLWKASNSENLRKEISYDYVVIDMKDIELGLKGPIERFPSIKLQSVAGWEYACLSQKTA